VKRSFHVLFLAALVCTLSHAEGEEAVVLSGGGSLGIAHAGALLGIERRGHDPDIVLGTSMGAVVGALYAAGYSPDSIWSLMRHEDWRGMFTPIPIAFGPTRALRYPAIHLQRADGEFMARGLVSDWRINRDLTHQLFAASVRARGNFDRLPRRYRSVAADLETGELVPIGSGDLARAARASMASPGFFPPIEWNGRILTDGGINDYLPVDEARGMGADDVIAVDALMPLPRIPSLGAVHVADRSLRLMVVRSRAGKSRPDVLVRPDLDPELTGFNFPVDPTPILRGGLTAALRDVAPRASEDTRPRGAAAEPRSLGRLRVQAPGSPLGPFVDRAFRAFAGAPYEPRRILDRVDRLYATGCFDGVWPSVEDSTSTDAPAWIVRAESERRLSLVGSAGYDNDRGGRSWGALRGFAGGLSTPVQWELEGSANGVDRAGAFSLRIPTLGNPPTAWSAGGQIGESRIPFLTPRNAHEDAEVRRAGGWLGAEWLRIQPAMEGTAVFRGEHVSSDIGPDGSSFGPFVRIGFVPPLIEEVGVTPSAEGELRFGDVRYQRARLKGSLRGRRGRFAAAVLGDVEAAGGHPPRDAAPALGNESLIPSLRWGEHRGKARAVSGVDLAYSFPLQATVRVRLRGGVVADEMREDGTFGKETTWLGGAGLTALRWTPLGRLEAGCEAGTLGERRIVVRLGEDF
jgi:predicted acylesterase/phospholipase RssA